MSKIKFIIIVSSLAMSVAALTLLLVLIGAGPLNTALASGPVQQPAAPVEVQSEAQVEEQAMALAPTDVVTITILHTNDTHGRWDADTYYGNPTGFEYLATHIANERVKNPNVLLLDAGDTFQGNAFAQYFRNNTPNPIAGGMNLLDYDAMVLGNHEFNFGPTTFATMLGQVNFPILGANVTDDVTGTYGFINANVKDYITMTVGGLKVAIFGLTNPEVPLYELPSNIEGLSFAAATPTAQLMVAQIQAAEDPDLLIALNHIGYDVYKGSYDKDRAIAEQVPGIDVIVGGHSHTRLDPAVTITSTTNPTGTLVAHAYKYARYLGKVDIVFTGNITDGYEIVLREGYLLDAEDVTTDTAMTAYLDPFVISLTNYTERVLGYTTVPVDSLQAYTEETNGANLQADSAVFELAQHNIDVDFHLSGAMSARRVADGATATTPVTLTVDDMYTLMPYENSLVAMRMNGPQIKQVLERAYRNYYYYKYVPGYGGYSHYTTCMLDINAGGVITYTDTYPALPDGNNVKSLVIDSQPVDFLNASTYYTVSTVNYLAAGSCNFNDSGVTLWPLDQIVADTQYYVRDSVIDYISATGTITPVVEGRLVFEAAHLSVAKEVTPTVEVTPGDTVTYTITLESDGDFDATGVVMTDTLPPEIDFGGWVFEGSASVPGPTGGEIVWGPWTIGSGTTITYVFTATLKTGTAYFGIPVTNTIDFISTDAGIGSVEAVFNSKEGAMFIYLPLVMRNY